VTRRDDETEKPTISTPGDRRNGNGNGRRWWLDVGSKVVAGLLLFILVAFVTGAWAKARDAAAATGEVYALPPKVRALREDVDRLQAQPPMPAGGVEQLARAIAAELAKKPSPRPHP
jgi:hypothetical protein